jgi:hypothetical protein
MWTKPDKDNWVVHLWPATVQESDGSTGEYSNDDAVHELHFLKWLFSRISASNFI